MHLVNKYRDRLKEAFYLDSGGNVRRSKDGYQGRFKAGDVLQCFASSHGYLRFQVPGARATMNLAHLVVLLDGRDVPDHLEVDHIDGNKTNNHPQNLRLVTRRVNSCNRSIRCDNTSGVTGIRWSAYHSRFVIRRTVAGKRLSRSRKTFEEALEVLEELKQMDSDYTHRHGK